MIKNYIQKFDFFIDRKIDRKDFEEFPEDHFGGWYNFCYFNLSNSVKEKKNESKRERERERSISQSNRRKQRRSKVLHRY